MLRIVLKGLIFIILLAFLFIFSALALYYLKLFKPYEGATFDTLSWQKNAKNPQCARGKMLRDLINKHGRAIGEGKPYQNSVMLLGTSDYTGSNQWGICNFYHLGFCGYLYPQEFSMLRICHSEETQQVIDLYYYTTTEVRPLTPDPSLKTFRQVQEELRRQAQ